jgi:hypothetical protein
VKALLVRVGADQTEGGGWWNAPVNSLTREFVYVPIPEAYPIRRGSARPYSSLSSFVQQFGATLPDHLAKLNMHLDPDFDYLTYGDQGERAKQIRSKLRSGDLLVFYASLADTNSGPRLIYAIIGLYVIDTIETAASIPHERCHENAHTRRLLRTNANDIVVRARPTVSGRLQMCLPIGEFRDRAYRVTHSLLKTWGGLSVANGYLQRSARLPEIGDPASFCNWFKRQGPKFLATNN